MLCFEMEYATLNGAIERGLTLFFWHYKENKTKYPSYPYSQPHLVFQLYVRDISLEFLL